MKQISVLFLLFCGGLLFAENVLKNGCFEQDFNGWDYPYWEKKPMPGTIVTDVVYGGKKAFLLFKDGDKANYINTRVKIEPGKICQIRLMVKSENAPENDLFVRLLLYKADPATGKMIPAGFAWGGLPANQLIRTGGTHDWKEFVHEVNPANFKDGIIGATLFIYRKNNGSGKIYIDEVSVEFIENKAPVPTETEKTNDPASHFLLPAKNLWPADSSFETGAAGFALPRDFAQAFHGKASLRMDAGIFRVQSDEFFQILKPGKKYNFGFSVRADHDVRMEVFAVNDSYVNVGHKVFQAGSEWKRIELPLGNNGRASTGLKITFQKPKDAVVWLDAIQFNEGDPAPYISEAPLAIGMEPIGQKGQILFCSPEKLNAEISIRNNDETSRQIRITAELEPAFGEKQEILSFESEFQPGEVLRRELSLLAEQKPGYYVIRLSAESGNDRVKLNSSFLITNPPPDISEDSFFGLHGDSFARGIGMSWKRIFRFWQYWPQNKQGDYIVSSKPDVRGIHRMDTINISKPPAKLKRGVYADDKEIERYVIDLARGLGSKYIEIENEPDLAFPNIFGKGLEYGAEKYAEQINHLAPAIRKVVPGAKIMASGVSGMDFNSNFPFTEKVLATAGKNIDIFAIHPYSSARYIGPDHSDIGPEGNRVYAKTIDLKERIARHGGRQEIWYGEIGWALDVNEDFLSDSAFRQAAYLARLMLIGKAAGVKKVMYFTVDFHVERERYCYGIWRAGQPLPAAGAYAGTVQILEGAELVAILANNDFHSFLFRNRDGQNFAAVWLSTESKANLTLNLPTWQVEVRDMFNNLVEVTENDSLKLQISGNPLYLFPRDNSVPDWKEKMESARCDLPPLKALWRLRKADTLILRLENIRLQAQNGTLKLTGAPFQTPQRQFSLAPGAHTEFEFRSASSLGGREIRLDAKCSAGDYNAVYRSEIVGCPEFTPDITSKNTELPETGRLPVMNSRTYLLPNDPGNGWNGPDNLSVESAVCHDAKNLYVLINAQDDIHFQDKKPGRLWAGDSVQLAVDSMTNALPGVQSYDKDDYEFGFGLTPDGPQKELTGIYEVGRSKSALDSVKCNIFRQGELTCYRIAIPWKTMKLIPEKGMIFGLNFSVNDNDGHGIRFWMGITPGIVEAKNPYAFRKFVLE